jgi:hypothetical protein
MTLSSRCTRPPVTSETSTTNLASSNRYRHQLFCFGQRVAVQWKGTACPSAIKVSPTSTPSTVSRPQRRPKLHVPFSMERGVQEQRTSVRSMRPLFRSAMSRAAPALNSITPVRHPTRRTRCAMPPCLGLNSSMLPHRFLTQTAIRKQTARGSAANGSRASSWGPGRISRGC